MQHSTEAPFSLMMDGGCNVCSSVWIKSGLYELACATDLTLS